MQVCCKCSGTYKEEQEVGTRRINALFLGRKEVSSLSVHPSGLLALSTARDDMLRMWSMAKGRSQYKTKIAPGTEAVSFSPSGGAYALLSTQQVQQLLPFSYAHLLSKGIVASTAHARECMARDDQDREEGRCRPSALRSMQTRVRASVHYIGLGFM
jgi:hypothetical protein